MRNLPENAGTENQNRQESDTGGERNSLGYCPRNTIRNGADDFGFVSGTTTASRASAGQKRRENGQKSADVKSIQPLAHKSLRRFESGVIRDKRFSKAVMPLTERRFSCLYNPGRGRESGLTDAFLCESLICLWRPLSPSRDVSVRCAASGIGGRVCRTVDI